MEALSFPCFYHWMEPSRMCALWHRTSKDGVTFRVKPSYQRADDAAIALEHAPYAYSQDGVRFASWPKGYDNTSTPTSTQES